MGKAIRQIRSLKGKKNLKKINEYFKEETEEWKNRVEEKDDELS